MHDHAMSSTRLLALLMWFALSGNVAADCVPAPNHHCILIDGLAYVPNVLTVMEGDTVEFSASTFHPLRQVNRAFPSTTAFPGGLGCSSEPCIKVMDASVVDADQQPIFHFICTNHIQQVMRGDITIIRRTLFSPGFRTIFSSSFED